MLVSFRRVGLDTNAFGAELWLGLNIGRTCYVSAANIIIIICTPSCKFFSQMEGISVVQSHYIFEKRFSMSSNNNNGNLVDFFSVPLNLTYVWSGLPEHWLQQVSNWICKEKKMIFFPLLAIYCSVKEQNTTLVQLSTYIIICVLCWRQHSMFI